MNTQAPIETSDNVDKKFNDFSPYLDKITDHAYSGVIRPVIPITSGHPYRFDPAGDSGASGHPVFT